MDFLPTDLFQNILSRIPAEQLLFMKSVSKKWLKEIEHPEFAKIQIKRQTLLSQDAADSVGYVLFRNFHDIRVHANYPSWDMDFENGGKSYMIPLKHRPFMRHAAEKHRLPTYSCNGLFVVPHGDKSRIRSIWNPLTGDSLKLPTLNTMARKNGMRYFTRVNGFGYESESDDYKVVTIAQRFDPVDGRLEAESHVYSLKSDRWRRIADPPNWLSRWTRGVFVNGALHWTSRSRPMIEHVNLIVALDLRTENYVLVPLPSELTDPSLQKKAPKVDLCVLDGCLSLSCIYRKRYEVWLMKNESGTSSWTKLISHELPYGINPNTLPIAYTKSIGRVLVQSGRQFVWSNVEEQSIESIIKTTLALVSAEIYVPSLVKVSTTRRIRLAPNAG